MVAERDFPWRRVSGACGSDCALVVLLAVLRLVGLLPLRGLGPWLNFENYLGLQLLGLLPLQDHPWTPSTAWTLTTSW